MTAGPTQDSLSVTCGSCGKKFRAAASAAGKRGKCPHCGVAVEVPAAAVAVPVGSARPAPDQAAPAESAAPADQKSKSKRTWLALGIAAWFLAVGAGTVITYKVFISKPVPAPAPDYLASLPAAPSTPAGPATTTPPFAPGPVSPAPSTRTEAPPATPPTKPDVVVLPPTAPVAPTAPATAPAAPSAPVTPGTAGGAAAPPKPKYDWQKFVLYDVSFIKDAKLGGYGLVARVWAANPEFFKDPGMQASLIVFSTPVKDEIAGLTVGAGNTAAGGAASLSWEVTDPKTGVRGTAQASRGGSTFKGRFGVIAVAFDESLFKGPTTGFMLRAEGLDPASNVLLFTKELFQAGDVGAKLAAMTQEVQNLPAEEK